MQYFALACDYDGTIAEHGRVSGPTVEALERLRRTGRKLILISGRQLDDLLNVFPECRLFDAVVAENGAVLHDVALGTVTPLASAPPPEFVRALEGRHVNPLSIGRVIVATWEPQEQTVLQVIRELNLDLQVIFNKGAVMVLPTGINKASGLQRALEELRLSPQNTVGIGDAENDLAFLTLCGCGVAVANALDTVKSRADWVTSGDHGRGVAELIERLIDSDLIDLRTVRNQVVIAQAIDGTELSLQLRGGHTLIAGPSGAGKTRMTTILLEKISAARFQFCVIDPEGDYDELPYAIALRSGDSAALVEEAKQVLERPGENAVINLMDVRLEDRPLFLPILLPRLLELRSAKGRPHWVVIDEAHHLLEGSTPGIDEVLKAFSENLVLVTVHPDHVATPALMSVRTAIIVGRNAQETAAAFARGRGEPAATMPVSDGDTRLAWWLKEGSPPRPFRAIETIAERQRHHRKYAEGELGEDRSFYFRGPGNRLNLRAQNLELFKQIGDGVDDETWTYHLQRHDVSQWFRDVIKDESLATEAAEIENAALSAPDSRQRIRQAIERRYTRPA